LPNRNALAVRQDPDFHRDMTRLIQELEAVVGRSPSLPQLGTAKRLELGVFRFFRAQGEFAPPIPLVFGEAKSIVRRFKSEQNVFEKVQAKIEERKRTDANWTFANQLNAGLGLVHALGLAPETEEDNRTFLLMPLPEGLHDTKD
jgi:hypothetical protein